MDETVNLKLPFIMPSQAQKHVTHNEALRALDAIVQIAVVDRDRNDPPVGPVEGQRHALGAVPTGVFAGHAGEIAAYQDGAWAFYVPRQGWLIWDASDGVLLARDGSDWRPVVDWQGVPMIGINATADTTNRLAVAADATLLTHAGAGHQLKINKASAGDTSSLLFQTAWAGRAEIGLAGSDDFAVKVSADGSTWHTALMIDRNTGAVALPNTALGLEGPIKAQAYDVAALPSPSSTGAGAIIYVSDEVGGATLAFSDGTDWRRVSDRAVVS